MKFIVQLWDGKKYDIILDDDHVNFTNFLSTTLKTVDPDGLLAADNKSIKFLCKGKVINETNFIEVLPGSLLWGMKQTSASTSASASVSNVSTPGSSTPTLSATPTSTSVSAPVSAHVSAPVSAPMISEPSYTYKNVKATIIVFLNMVRSNPQLRDLYENNFGQLMTELMKNPDLDQMIRNILSQSGQIASSMEKGENISVKISGNTESGKDIGDIEEIELTREDEENIEEITEMGFDSTDVVVTYLRCNKDKEATVRKLTDMD
jgi:hypothetical protein